MSRREDIESVIWQDPDFDALSTNAAFLYLWSFTNPRCGMAGLYKVSRRQLCEGRLDPDIVDGALDELRDARFAFYEDGVLWVRTRVKHLRTRTEQIAKSIRADLERVGDHPLRARFLEAYLGTPWLDPHLNLNGGSAVSQSEAEKRGSVEPQSRFQGKGSGKGSAVEGNSGKGSSQEFDSWLEHYRETTKRPHVRGSQPARDAFRARRREGLSVEDLKLATVGAHSDEFCRENGHDVPDTILRASKVTRYIELGRKIKPPRRGPKRTREQRIEELVGMGVSREEAEVVAA